MHFVSSFTTFVSRTVAAAAIALVSSTFAVADSVTLLVNGPAGTQAGWVLHTDKTRQWVDADCRRSLEDAGINTVVTDWRTIGQYDSGTWMNCAALADSIDASGTDAGNDGNPGVDNPETNDPTGFRLLVNAGSTDGSAFSVGAEQTRQWINPQCRQALVSAGMREEIVQWSVISDYPSGPWLSCVALEAAFLNAVDSSPETPDEPVDGGDGPQVTDVTDDTPDDTGPDIRNPDSERSAQCMGVNDGFIANWDGGQMVTDAFKKARGPFKLDYRTPSQTDADSWPSGNEDVVFVIGEGNHGLADLNPWVLLPYDQSGAWIDKPTWGKWQLSGSQYVGQYNHAGVVGHEFNLGQQGTSLRVFADSLPDTPRNRWHLVPKSAADAYMAAMQAENFSYIFNTDKYGLDLNFPLLHDGFKNQMEGFCRIRYMQGDRTNSNAFSGLAKDRTKPSYPVWDYPGGDGKPYEWEVWIANHLGIDVWHADHVRTWEGMMAGDSYLNDQATYYATHLTGNVIREYANEIWNSAWPFGVQTNWVWENAPYADRDHDDFANLDYGYGKRTYDTAKVWDRAYTDRREDLDLTVGIHTANYSSAPRRLIGPLGEAWHELADSLAPSFYFGGSFASGSEVYRTVLRQGQSAVVQYHESGLASWKQQITRVIGVTSQLVERYHLYEGASHFTLYDYDAARPDDVIVGGEVIAYLKSSNYAAHLQDLFTFWAALPQAGEPMWFNLYGVNTPAKPFALFDTTSSEDPEYEGAGRFVMDYRKLHSK